LPLAYLLSVFAVFAVFAVAGAALGFSLLLPQRRQLLPGLPQQLLQTLFTTEAAHTSASTHAHPILAALTFTRSWSTSDAITCVNKASSAVP
jgi:hypothetical protein